ncbi:MAG: sulfonate transport system ATP-binding protein [Methanothermococcus sp.]|jgi:NitT/TauT family transport system ATP-binding protein|uniref:ABC transporter ATP-binding protein n=1 Tax=Methanothermococcus TaxID=155862 RepID=UPI00037399E7|nr:MULTISPECIES: ABC transporter ATP-binding protein [Methanothermococcus]MDK2789930.1 sulfonate transport system ATP-binding protein [Methanothermococcus sp.]MDK2987306.1 sulfonate transport system ATP-binding protein [Methanothermococcus sp.]
MAVILELENITKKFFSQKKEILAVDNVSLKVRNNEFLSIVGPSGCGKSTILRMIAGLETPTSGKILLENKEVNEPDADRGMVFQQYTLLPWRTVLENVTFGLEVKGMPKSERIDIARKFIKMVGLEGFEEAYPYELSGGMQQRVAIARTLANDPKIVLMDEPFGALDTQTRAILQDHLLKIWQKDRKTVVFVTHSVEEAIYLSDRVIIMTARPGKIKSVIDIDLERPRKRTSLEFLEYKKRIIDELKSEVFKSYK